MSNSCRDRCRFRRYQSESAARSSAVATVVMAFIPITVSPRFLKHIHDDPQCAGLQFAVSGPDTEGTADRDELADMICRVIRGEQDGAEIRLVPFAGRHLRGQILDVAGQPLQCLT